ALRQAEKRRRGEATTLPRTPATAQRLRRTRCNTGVLEGAEPPRLKEGGHSPRLSRLSEDAAWRVDGTLGPWGVGCGATPHTKKEEGSRFLTGASLRAAP